MTAHSRTAGCNTTPLRSQLWLNGLALAVLPCLLMVGCGEASGSTVQVSAKGDPAGAVASVADVTIARAELTIEGKISALLDPTNYGGWSELASRALAAGDHERAVSLLGEAIWSNPRFANAYHYDEPERMIPRLTDQIGDNPGEDARTLYLLLRRGSLLMGVGRAESARRDMEAALALEPGNPIALQILANVTRESAPDRSLAYSGHLVGSCLVITSRPAKTWIVR